MSTHMHALCLARKCREALSWLESVRASVDLSKAMSTNTYSNVLAESARSCIFRVSWQNKNHLRPSWPHATHHSHSRRYHYQYHYEYESKARQIDCTASTCLASCCCCNLLESRGLAKTFDWPSRLPFSSRLAAVQYLQGSWGHPNPNPSPSFDLLTLL